MRRIFVCICVLLIAAGAFAQERRGISRPPVSSSFLGPMIDRMDADSRLKTAGVRRDAFIVSQVIAAVGDLEDFQRNAAMEKAHDHIEAAVHKCHQEVNVSPGTSESSGRLGTAAYASRAGRRCE